MSAVLYIFGLAWLVMGLLELRTALTHAGIYAYRPVLYAAWYWLAISLGALIAAVFLPEAV